MIADASLTLYSIRRRFEQNQIDCTFTVLALLPTVTEGVLDALPVEQLTQELQTKKAERIARSTAEGAPSEISSSGAPSLRDGDTASLTSLQSSSFVHASQAFGDGESSQPRKSKAQLWNEIKVSSITRALTLLYTLSLLTLLTRIQLNLLGRLNYLVSVISLAQPPTPERQNSISLEDHDSSSASFGNDFETNRRYLTFSWFLLHKGSKVIQRRVQEAVSEVFGSISPAEQLSQSRLSELIIQVRKKIEGATQAERHATHWLPFLLPLREEEESLLVESGVITPPNTASSSSSPHPPQPLNINSEKPSSKSIKSTLRTLLDETADLIDSPHFTHILTLLLNSAFTYLIDERVSSAFPPKQSDPRTEDLNSAITVVPTSTEPRVKLATILAVLTRQAHVIGSGDTPNEYIERMNADVKELEAFAAVIYAQDVRPTGEAEEEEKPISVVREASGGAGSASEVLESQLEGAWSRVVGSASRTLGSGR